MTNKEIQETEAALLSSLRKLVHDTRPKEDGTTLDPKAVQEAVDQAVRSALENLELEKRHLGKELLDFLTNNQTLRLELPSGVTVDVPDAALIPSFLKIVDDIVVGNNVFLHGEAGTGKTTLAKSVARSLNRGFVTITCNQFTSPIQIVGGQTIEGYKQGKLIEAWKEGKMLILDELPKMDPNTAGVVNDALANTGMRGAVIFDGNGDPHEKHDDFCCIATGNTTGKGTSPRYNGNNKLDLSLIDRFQGSYYEVGFNEKLERAVVFPATVNICLRIREQLRVQNADEIMTLRTMMNLDRIYVLEMERIIGTRPPVPNGKTLKDALDSYFGIMNADKAKVIQENIEYEQFLNTYRQDLRGFRAEAEKRLG